MSTAHRSPKNHDNKSFRRTEAEVVWAASRNASCTRGLADTGHQASATSTFRVTSTLQRTQGCLG